MLNQRGGFGLPFLHEKMQKLIQLIQSKDIAAAKERYLAGKSQMPKRDQLFFAALIDQLNGENLKAKEKYQALLNQFPNDVGGVVNLSAIHNENNNFGEALKVLSLLGKNSRSNEISLAKFDAYFGLHDYAKADESLQIISIDFQKKPAFSERVAALKIQQKKPEEAIELLERLLSSGEGNRASILSNLSAAYNKIGESEKSYEHAKLACELNPKSWQSKLNHATSLLALERYTESRSILEDLLQQGRRDQEVLINIARLTSLFGEIDLSMQYCNEGLRKNPNEIALLTCLADNYSVLREREKSYFYFDKVFQLDPFNELASWHIALSLLRDGQYEKGWEQYKWGFKRKTGGRGEYKFDPKNEWKRQSKTEKVVVWGEQGIGDQLMFAKFIKYIPEETVNVEFQVDSRLVQLFNDRLITRNRVTVTAYDSNITGSHIPAGNLPAELWSNYSDDIERKKPFLIRKNAPQNKGPIRVGITWRGGKTERMQSKRSVPLGLFPRLKSLSTLDVKVIQLQYNPIDSEIAYLQKNFRNKLSLPKYDAIKDLDSWVDHIDSCDLLISVDNSAVHFAGAMGIPTLVMIPSHPDFRWGLNGSSNPWYEDIELLRDFASMSLDDLASAIDNWVFEQTVKIRGN